MTPIYPEAYIEHWAEVFVRRRVRQRLHISFERFLERPQQLMNRVERYEAGERSSRDLATALKAELERHAERAEWLGEQLVDRSPRDRKRWRRPWFQFNFRRRR